MVVVNRPRPVARRRAPLVDRALGTSRRRRQAAYLAIGAGLAMLRPTIRRLAIGAAVGFLCFSVLVLVVAIRLS